MGGSALVIELRKNSQSLNPVTDRFFSKRKMSGIISITALMLGSLGLASCSGGATPSAGLATSYATGQGATSQKSSRPFYGQKTGRSFGAGQTRRFALGGGVRKVGKPYKILGRWYTPKHQPHYDKIGIASWYGKQFHGKKTANGEIFDMNNLTAAHPTLPIPSYVRVTNLSNRRTLILRVNDRGPYAHGRVMDLSRKAAELLDTEAKGTARVRVQYIGPAPLDGNLSREQAHLARQPWFGNKYSSKKLKNSWNSRVGLGGPSK